jgi:hypothetical protein
MGNGKAVASLIAQGTLILVDHAIWLLFTLFYNNGDRPEICKFLLMLSITLCLLVSSLAYLLISCLLACLLVASGKEVYPVSSRPIKYIVSDSHWQKQQRSKAPLIKPRCYR